MGTNRRTRRALRAALARKSVGFAGLGRSRAEKRRTARHSGNNIGGLPLLRACSGTSSASTLPVPTQRTRESVIPMPEWWRRRDSTTLRSTTPIVGHDHVLISDVQRSLLRRRKWRMTQKHYRRNPVFESATSHRIKILRKIIVCCAISVRVVGEAEPLGVAEVRMGMAWSWVAWIPELEKRLSFERVEVAVGIEAVQALRAVQTATGTSVGRSRTRFHCAD